MQQTTIEQLEQWVQQALERYEKNGETYYCGKSDALNDVLLKIRELKVVAPVAEGSGDEHYHRRYFSERSAESVTPVVEDAIKEYHKWREALEKAFDDSEANDFDDYRDGAEWAKQYFEQGNTNKQCD